MKVNWKNDYVHRLGYTVMAMVPLVLMLGCSETTFKVKPAEDAKTKPTEDAKAKPTEDAKAKPTEDAKAKPTEDAKAKPTEEWCPRCDGEGKIEVTVDKDSPLYVPGFASTTRRCPVCKGKVEKLQ